MAFSPKSLVRKVQAPIGETTGVAGADMVSEFLYATKDADTVVEAANYFGAAAAAGTIKKGDIINVICSFGGSVERKDYVVTAAALAGTNTIALTSAS